MHKSKIKQITLAVCLAFMPFTGFAAGLGKLNVSSGLGEPLKAEIELLSVTPEELSTLVAAIASEDAYAAQGVQRLAIHSNIQVEVSKSASGAPILKLRSAQPISDPYLDMLIQVDWSTGRLQREYTVLLDPPGYKEPVENAMPMAIKPPTANSTATNTAVTEDRAQPTAKKSKKSRKNRQSPVAQDNNPQEIKTELSGDEVTTKNGDTLSSIAKQTQVEGVNLDQMLIGLYESNKEAFAGGNMNRLKVGQIIKVPTKDSLAAIDTKEAHQQVKVQSANWNEYRNKLAGTVVSTPAAAEGEQKQASSGKITTAEDKAAPVKTGPQDVVKLSAGDKAKTGGAKEFEAKINALQEETTAREKSLKEAQERTAALEKQIQDMQKLLALKNQTMANAQKNAEVAKVPDPAPAKPVEEKPTQSAETAPPTKVAESAQVQPTPAASAAPEANPVEAKAAETKPEDNKAIAPAPKPKAVPPVVAQPVTEPSLLDSLMNGIDLTIVGALGGVALLGAGWMFLRNKRRKDLDSFERGILTSGGLRANTVFGNTTGTASTSDTSFLTDFAQSADGSMIDTNDVDPIAEAEVYMAYGRDAQAEEILKDAITKEPKRYELHLKLLEMYAARKDTSAFEAIAGELYTTLGADDPTWAKVAEIGAAMEPENPLYNVSPSTTSSTEATQKLNISDFANAPVSDESDLDFSFDAVTPVEDANSVVMQSFAASDTSEDKSVAFDLGSLEDNDTKPSFDNSALNSSSEQKVADNTMDFDMGDFDLGTPAAESGIESNVEFTAESDAMKTMDNLPAFDMSPTMDAMSTAATEVPAFDMAPTFDLPTTEESPAPAAPEAISSDFDMDFNFPTDSVADTPASNETTADEISFDLGMAMDEPNIADTAASDEISFDLPEIQETDDISISMSEAPSEFDLSTISLDLTEPGFDTSNFDTPNFEGSGLDSSGLDTATMPGIEVTEDAPIAEESEDVNIKLDLVAAYIDMDDKEGARELLEEVLKEGGEHQKSRAQQLLASLA